MELRPPRNTSTRSENYDGNPKAEEVAYNQAMMQGASGGSAVTRVITRHAYDDHASLSDPRAMSPSTRQNIKRIVSREKQNNNVSDTGGGDSEGGSMSRHSHRLGVAQNNLTVYQARPPLASTLHSRAVVSTSHCKRHISLQTTLRPGQDVARQQTHTQRRGCGRRRDGGPRESLDADQPHAQSR